MTTTRRRLLSTVGAGVAVGLAGCAGGSGGGSATGTPTPVDLGGGKTDDQGGMVIGRHAGPNGQIFYADHEPEGHGNPAWFHTLVMGLFPYYFEHQRRGWTAVAIYVTDYSLVDYELSHQGRGTFISSHTGADTFAPARSVRYVAGSELLGGMGPDLIPFSDDAERDRFVADHGGRVIGFDDVTPESLMGFTR